MKLFEGDRLGALYARRVSGTGTQLEEEESVFLADPLVYWGYGTRLEDGRFMLYAQGTALWKVAVYEADGALLWDHQAELVDAVLGMGLVTAATLLSDGRVVVAIWHRKAKKTILERLSLNGEPEGASVLDAELGFLREGPGGWLGAVSRTQSAADEDVVGLRVADLERL